MGMHIEYRTRDYDCVADTGSNRHLGTENRLAGRREQRALLVTQFYMAISRLVIDALVGPDAHDRYHMESNDDLSNNPRGSTFQSFLHLFCNITNAPTDVYVFHKAPNLPILSTFMYPPPEPHGGWDSVNRYPIRF